MVILEDIATIKNNPQKSESSTNNSSENPLESLSNEQCQNLLSMLQSHLSKAKTNADSPSNSHIAGMCSQTKLIPHVKNDMWILDSGAPTHICHNKNLFHLFNLYKMPQFPYQTTLMFLSNILV